MKRIKVIVFAVLFSLVANKNFAQEYKPESKEEPSFMYEDVSMILVVDGVGSYNVSTLYTEDDRIFLSIEDVLGVNEIDINSTRKGDTITGFFKTEDNRYFLDYTTGSFVIGNKTINVSKYLTKLLGVVYLDYTQYGDLFGLKLIYNSKKLTLDLKADYETPILKRIKLDKKRVGGTKKNNDEIVADTIIKRKYHLFKPGILDWKLTSSQTVKDTIIASTQIGFASEFLYGATNVFIPIDVNSKIDGHKLNYNWRWVDDEKTLVRQANVGRISLPLVSSLSSETVGFTVKNTPTTVIKASGYYTISDYTQPNWTVELYINNTLESFTRSDASGLFVFKIPIVYGYTTLMLKFYGNRGEERTEERFLVAPNNIMPAKHFQYNIGGGFVKDTIHNAAGTLNAMYGLNRFITVAGGVECLSKIKNGQKYLTYTQVTFQPINKLLLYSEYVHQVKFKNSLNIYLKLNSVLTIEHTLFDKTQTSISTQNKEVRKILLNTPFKIGKGRFIYKFEGIENVLSESKNEQITNVISYSKGRLNINSTTEYYATNFKKTAFTTSLYASYYTQKRYVFTSTSDFDLLSKKIKNLKFSIEKVFKLGTVSLAYENKLIQKSEELVFKLRLDLSAVKVNFESKLANKKLLFTESLIGSIALGGGEMVNANNSMNGKGGMVLTYFLDINNNNKLDKGEIKVPIEKVKVNSSKLCSNSKDTTLIVYDLNAFQDCIVENEIKELENISWRYKKDSYKVMIDPNQFKKIDIPIEVMGEVNGFVYKQVDASTVKGMGKVNVKFYHLTNPNLVYTIQSESDGFFTFIGLVPGEYAAIIDPVQLEKIGYQSSEEVIKFTIKATNEGDVVGGLEFYLNQKK